MSLPKPAKPPGYLPTFCLHFVLPNVLLGVAALVTGGLGAEYGLTYLIWHDDPAKQFWVGFGLGLVVLQALYVGFLLWAKKAGRPEKVVLDPALVEAVNSRSFLRYSAWVVGQLGVVLAIVATLVLLVQFIDGQDLPGQTSQVEEADNVPPPRPNYTLALPLGALAAGLVVFLGGWATRVAIGAFALSHGSNRRMMNWLNASAERHPHAPTRGGLIVALWSAGIGRSGISRMWIALFSQSLCLAVGVVFAAAWELSNLPVAIGVGATLFVALVTVRARWLNDGRVFRILIFLLVGLCYFVITWLGSRSWCGWPGAFFVTLFLLAAWPLGLRYAFPGPTAHLLRSTNARIIDPALCRKYPFHGVAIAFLLLGALALFVLPMAFEAVRSPMILGCFLVFLFVALYGFVAYAIDDALPFLAPALIVLVVLSGMPRYKMQFPGLDYVARGSSPSPLLDLEQTVKLDRDRQLRFDRAVASGNAAEADRLWMEVERENRILPGKDLRPGVRAAGPGPLLKLDDIAFSTIPATISDLSQTGDRKPIGKKPMVVLVASGGGIRAAVWTFLVLSELEARFAAEGIPFPYHVRLISGASGGMFGASYYVRSLRAPGEMDWGPNRGNELAERMDKLTGDWLTPLCERMVLNDVPGFLSPFPAHTDRGIALEAAWSNGLDGELDMSFQEIGRREREGWCPSIAFSPMIVEDGRRLLISNLDLRYPASNDGHLLEPDPNRPAALAEQNRNYSHEALELFRMFPGSRNRFALSTAIRMSASFPFLSPAVPLPTNPRRRVVDAGYFDNYGVSLAASFLFSKKSAIWLKENVSKVVLIQIRDGQSDDERRLEAIPDTATRGKGIGSLVSRSLEELTSPLEGLNNGRVGTCSFRNDGLLELLSTYFEQLRGEPGSGQIPHRQRFFTVVNFEFAGHAALSWHLSNGERAQIRRSFTDAEGADKLRKKIDDLLEWWKADVWEAPPDKTRVVGRAAK